MKAPQWIKGTEMSKREIIMRIQNSQNFTTNPRVWRFDNDFRKREKSRWMNYSNFCSPLIRPIYFWRQSFCADISIKDCFELRKRRRQRWIKCKSKNKRLLITTTPRVKEGGAAWIRSADLPDVFNYIWYVSPTRVSDYTEMSKLVDAMHLLSVYRPHCWAVNPEIRENNVFLHSDWRYKSKY